MQPAVCDYAPVHFIRCHSGDKKAIKHGHTDDDPTDHVTNVWCCAMEPNPDDSGFHYYCTLADSSRAAVSDANVHCWQMYDISAEAV